MALGMGSCILKFMLHFDDDFRYSPSEKQPPRDWDPLVKQTYSVWVDTDKGRRKWHLSGSSEIFRKNF